jgi:HPr kinase/phosphorylase
MNTGVLITGASGVGKSEVALDLVQRGHQLVADDAVEIYRRDGAELVGECSPTLKGYVEIRGLGIINIDKMFGPASVLDFYPLQLIINLKDATNKEIRSLDRLQPSLNMVEILGIQVPRLSMLVAPGRNLAVLIEAATRDFLLRKSGIDSSLDFVNNHDRIMGIEEIG